MYKIKICASEQKANDFLKEIQEKGFIICKVQLSTVAGDRGNWINSILIFYNDNTEYKKLGEI